MKIFALVAMASALKLSDEKTSADVSKWQGTAHKWDKKNPHPGYFADMDGFDGNWSYTRVVPSNFDGPGSGDDQFMNSMLTKYAFEASTPEGKPTGEFYFNYTAALMAAQEVVETHLGLTGDAKQAYLDQYFDKTFRHFDTAADGKIESARMGGFFRFLCANMQITLH